MGRKTKTAPPEAPPHPAIGLGFYPKGSCANLYVSEFKDGKFILGQAGYPGVRQEVTREELLVMLGEADSIWTKNSEKSKGECGPLPDVVETLKEIQRAIQTNNSALAAKAMPEPIAKIQRHWIEQRYFFNK